MDELKKCPHCPGKAMLFEDEEGIEFVECFGCGATSVSAKAWNTRTDTEPLFLLLRGIGIGVAVCGIIYCQVLIARICA